MRTTRLILEHKRKLIACPESLYRYSVNNCGFVLELTRRIDCRTVEDRVTGFHNDDIRDTASHRDRVRHNDVSLNTARNRSLWVPGASFTSASAEPAILLAPGSAGGGSSIPVGGTVTWILGPSNAVELRGIV
jgi:hypothetical protein